MFVAPLLPSMKLNECYLNGEFDTTGEEDEIGVGSQFTPKTTAIKNWVSEAISKLNRFSAFDVSRRLENLIDYHNKYTTYTLILLINASGYRTVYSPLPSLDLLLTRYNALCISDKDSSKTFSHTRIVACPTVLKRQLKHYQEHIHTMANPPVSG